MSQHDIRCLRCAIKVPLGKIVARLLFMEVPSVPKTGKCRISNIRLQQAIKTFEDVFEEGNKDTVFTRLKSKYEVSPVKTKITPFDYCRKKHVS